MRDEERNQGRLQVFGCFHSHFHSADGWVRASQGTPGGTDTERNKELCIAFVLKVEMSMICQTCLDTQIYS